jgi:anti-sigma-K factor RskA
LAAGFALVAIVFGSLYFTQQAAVEQPAYVSVVTDPTTGPVWLLQSFERARALRVTTVNPRPAPAASSYELWMLPGGGAQPVSLGLLPAAGNATLALSVAQLAVLGNTPTLAVTVEPAGGSPTGRPTLPVIYTAPLLRT